MSHVTRDTDVIAAVDWSQAGVRPVAVKWISSRSDSIVAEVTVSDAAGERDVIYKEHRAEADLVRGADVRARHEYDILALLGSAMNGARSVPRPLLVDERRGAIVTERAHGVPLDEVIRGAKRRGDARSSLARPMRQAGLWLRELQDATRKEIDGRDVLRGIIDGTMRNLECVVAGDRAVRWRRTRIARRLRTLERRVAGAPQRIVGHHGDYWPGNVYMEGERVEAIDFEGFRDGFELEDAAYFTIMLDLLFPRARHALPHARSAFFDGYAGGRAIDRSALELFTMTKALHMLARNAGAQHSLLLRLWTRHRLRDILLRCTG